ncbi:hypothetical protein NEUTE1DRAFT_91241 [Neurospora tetrasperma FGSC 2508]|uniref:Zn(2)-C6 fungal-type domain-containing protein n=1 Tax=Neurospora tetrasperma (strain FGSC 2508 / ATCC MYA-4615 / P0657) TaxID=510951 RepID=F8N4D3_NEUT8|nr:uncharacterized protein NEUTE1DRAFT_91241 [Neurospora tetrasperma FGSC 2508]EGO52674.1 hypothetical protein NEUTE1DRAFT_91241 [Neurospora tetrasperma FGSC 2508]
MTTPTASGNPTTETVHTISSPLDAPLEGDVHHPGLGEQESQAEQSQQPNGGQQEKQMHREQHEEHTEEQQQGQERHEEQHQEHHQEQRPDQVHEQHQERQPEYTGPAVLHVPTATIGIVESHGHSPRARKDTNSSISTITSAATAATSCSIGSSPSLTPTSALPTQNIFSLKDGNAPLSSSRNRRRTGPLAPEARGKAALIRKQGSCANCKRKKIGCDARHHGMTWEELAQKFPNSAEMQQLEAIVPPTPNFHTQESRKHNLSTPSPEFMDIDSSPTQQQIRSSFSESRVRTPLPSKPRQDRASTVSFPQPNGGLSNGNVLMSNSHGATVRASEGFARDRYRRISALFLRWQDDEDPALKNPMDEFREVLGEYYDCSCQTKIIPSANQNHNVSMWVLDEILQFLKTDTEDELKMLYWSSHSYLDADRQMILASSRSSEAQPASCVRWSAIQALLDHASPDVVVIMDAAYYPNQYRFMRRTNRSLELLAASTQANPERGVFTRALSDQLRIRAHLKLLGGISIADLHARVTTSPLLTMGARVQELLGSGVGGMSLSPPLSSCPPVPLYLQFAGSPRTSSIILTPKINRELAVMAGDDEASGRKGGTGGLVYTFRVPAGANQDIWEEYLSTLPDDIKGRQEFVGAG